MQQSGLTGVPHLALDRVVGLNGGPHQHMAWHAPSDTLVYACDNLLVAESASTQAQRCAWASPASCPARVLGDACMHVPERTSACMHA